MKNKFPSRAFVHGDKMRTENTLGKEQNYFSKVIFNLRFSFIINLI